jgi:uncharacterized protein HemX
MAVPAAGYGAAVVGTNGEWTGQHVAMTATWVLDEDDALALLAYLVTSARTQVDEAAEYGPLRLLTAAHRLGEMIGARASDATREFVTGPLDSLPLLAVPRTDRDGYIARLDDLCRALAEHLKTRYATGEAST